MTTNLHENIMLFLNDRKEAKSEGEPMNVDDVPKTSDEELEALRDMFIVPSTGTIVTALASQGHAMTTIYSEFLRETQTKRKVDYKEMRVVIDTLDYLEDELKLALVILKGNMLALRALRNTASKVSTDSQFW